MCVSVCSHVWVHTCTKRLEPRCICSQIWGQNGSAWVEQAISSSGMSGALHLEEMFLAHLQFNQPLLHPASPVFFSGGAHACSPPCALFWRFSSCMVVLHELELGQIRRKETAAFACTHEEPEDQLDHSRSMRRALWQMRRPWTCWEACFFHRAFAAVFCILLRWLWELCEDSQLRCKKICDYLQRRSQQTADE